MSGQVHNLVMERAVYPSQNSRLASLDFSLPADLEAAQPPETRGLSRDQVRLMVSYLGSDQVVHSEFPCLAEFLRPGDVLVINTSGTLKAALNARKSDGMPFELHLSTRLQGGLWVVELRQSAQEATLPYLSARAGEVYHLPGGGQVTLHVAYQGRSGSQPALLAQTRLWVASLELPLAVETYLEQYGFPIRYKYVHNEWPISYYQNVYATEMGSAEMPSAGRAFTPELITKLVAQGIQFAPLILHTGVASLGDDELPYEEYYRIPAATARVVNNARRSGGRVIAIGTTSVRALETTTAPDGLVHPAEGWTDLLISPHRRLRSVDGLLTGFHEPRSTHLSMMLAMAGYDHLLRAYSEALSARYLWHEFGDLHLALPAPTY